MESFKACFSNLNTIFKHPKINYLKVRFVELLEKHIITHHKSFLSSTTTSFPTRDLKNE